jgi:hypothetical protein
MKINPPARSSSPTSLKKPRIMRHLDICNICLAAVRLGAPSAISEAGREIQPHQHLTDALPSGLPAPKASVRR